MFTALGVVCGQATWAVATAAGLAALLAASEPAFLVVKVVGAAYLVWLGAQALLGAVRGGGTAGRPAVTGPAPGLAPAAALCQGLFSNLTNPKMAAFFPSLLPQFTAGDATPFPGLLLLGLVFCAMTLAWLTGYALLLGEARGALDRPAVRRVLEGLTGAVLVALGLRLATER